MENITRALALSIIARGWSSALMLLAVPFYIRFLGVEAYGVVGLFASLSVLVSFLDFGLGATFTRELAKMTDNPRALPCSRNLALTFEFTYALVAIFITLVVFCVSKPVAIRWVQVQALDRMVVAHALELAGIALACQWPTNLYGSGLVGLQMLAQLSVGTMIFVTLRVIFTLVALLTQPSLEVFFYAQIFSSFLQAVGMRWLLWSNLALDGHRPSVVFKYIQSSIRFAGGMTGITITSIVLTQADKLILSRLLSLEEFGVYVVASVLVSGLYIVISPVFSVMYPRFSVLICEENKENLVELYHTGSQAIVALLVPVASVIAIFAYEVLYVWTGDAGLSQQAGEILSVLVIGTACNGIMNMPYALQLASGWTGLALCVNLGAVIILMPIIWWATSCFGAMGGAAAWALFNLSCFFITPNIMHRRILLGEQKEWYIRDIFLPSIVCISMLILLRKIHVISQSRIIVTIILILYWILSSIVVIIFVPRIYKRVVSFFGTRKS
ncbi:Polysaccharide biosynthesis protein [anaerobic digester metagenome]